LAHKPPENYSKQRSGEIPCLLDAAFQRYLLGLPFQEMSEQGKNQEDNH
jgi:hypothetical protein